MKKQILVIIFVLGLMSCSKNINNINLNNNCTQVNYSENKIDKINIPDFVGNTPTPEISGFKVIEKTFPVNPQADVIKGNKFVSIYNYNSQLVGKILDESGNEVVSRFKITEGNPSYKIITDKNLDYFLVFYLGYIKKFDLNGNQIGNEIKLDDYTLSNTLFNVNYSFDENKKELVVSWTSTILDHVDKSYQNNNILCVFFGCAVPAMVPAEYYSPVVNYIKFDAKLNYCFNRVVFSDITLGYISTEQESYSTLYITKEHDRIIVSLNSQSFKEINLSNNAVKNISLPISTEPNYPYNFITEYNNEFYYLSGQNTYKLDNNYKIINSKTDKNIKDFSETDINIINDKLKISPDSFISTDNLDLYKFKPEMLIDNSGYNSMPNLIKMENSFLYTYGNYFNILNKE